MAKVPVSPTEGGVATQLYPGNSSWSRVSLYLLCLQLCDLVQLSVQSVAARVCVLHILRTLLELLTTHTQLLTKLQCTLIHIPTHTNKCIILSTQL